MRSPLPLRSPHCPMLLQQPQHLRGPVVYGSANCFILPVNVCPPFQKEPRHRHLIPCDGIEKANRLRSPVKEEANYFDMAFAGCASQRKPLCAPCIWNCAAVQQKAHDFEMTPFASHKQRVVFDAPHTNAVDVGAEVQKHLNHRHMVVLRSNLQRNTVARILLLEHGWEKFVLPHRGASMNHVKICPAPLNVCTCLHNREHTLRRTCSSRTDEGVFIWAGASMEKQVQNVKRAIAGHHGQHGFLPFIFVVIIVVVTSGVRICATVQQKTSQDHKVGFTGKKEGAIIFTRK